jgi:lysophospholipase L1-like esterase
MSRKRRRSQRALGYAALVLGGVVAALASAELLVRFAPELVGASPAPFEACGVSRRQFPELQELRSVYGLDRPNVRALNAGALFETNAQGLRGRERTLAKPDGVFRIAVVGDSVSMGWGVLEEDTYAARLERALAARDRGARYEVINFGLAGLDARGAVDRFHERALPFDPDLVVYGFTLNDLEGDHYRRSQVDPEDFSELFRTRWKLQLWGVLAPRVQGHLDALWPRRGSGVWELDDNYFRNPAAWGELLAALDRLAETARQRDSCGVVLIHPWLHFLNALHPYHRHYQAVSAAAVARGLFSISPIEAFLGRKDRALWVCGDDPHPGAEAHALLAQELLRGLDALPARCWGSGEPERAPAGS